MKKITLLCLTFLGLQNIYAQMEKPIETKYRRSSLYTVMIDKPNLPYANEIKKHFTSSPIPEKFNDHNLGKRVFESNTFDFEAANQAKSEKNSSSEAALFATESEQKILNGIARDLVAKWFNRSEKGGFDMELVKGRGSYDASVLDIATAKASKRGLDMLADAGEELIKNTFVLVNDFKYISKEEVAEKAKGWLTTIGSVASSVGVSGASSVTSATSAVVDVAGKGYVVKTSAHLFQLVWDEETAARFYNDYWTTDQTITAEKKKAFDEATIFKLKYIGSDNSWADVQSTSFTKKTEEQLIEKATVKAVDAVIVKLQKDHDEFKTKTPLFTGEPITAKIGLKEGISDKSKFDVLEQQMDENGKTKYVVVGSIKVDTKYPIWDNRYGAEEENTTSTDDKTYFKKVSGKDFYPGMLIVQKKGK